MKASLRQDLPASIVVFFVAVPLCVGIALASGAPLYSGLIAGIIGGIVVGSISGSHLGVSGPAAGLAVIVAGAIERLGSFEAFLSAVVLAGDGSIHLRSVLKNTPVLDALVRVLDRGGVLIGVGPSASALCDPMTDRRGGAFALGLGVMPGLAIVTEIEAWPPDQLERARTLANTPLVELSTGDAVIRSADGWELAGSPTVHGDLPTA